jgi:hypothetical protein
MHDRITQFLDKARQVSDEHSIRQLCEVEINNLYAAYTIATVHKMMSQYRNALRTADISEAFLVHMRERQEASDTLRQQYAHSVGTRQRQQYPITNVDTLIERAQTCLTSSSYSHIIVGLELLTGRRPHEIGVTAQFTPTDNKHYVTFQGQAKTRDNVRSQHQYVIPVLVSGADVCTALARLRSLRTFASDQFDRTAGPTLRDARKTLFQSRLPEGALQVKEPLRKIYACIAYDWFAPANCSYNAYLADILGHGPDDVNTANSYQDFYLAVVK